MKTVKRKVGIIGTGWMAKEHILAMTKLPFYYPDGPKIELVAVTSSQSKNYKSFSSAYGIARGVDEEHFWREDFDSLIIASPCQNHFDHLVSALNKERLERIYIEKPLVSSEEELKKISLMQLKERKIQLGFQFLQIPAIQKARELFPQLGTPLHFNANYFHSGYLQKSYREKKGSRLLPAPVGGVTSDLASHLFSLMISFLGNKMSIKSAISSGAFDDVPIESDLCTHILLQDRVTGAIGSINVSRISAGHGDHLSFELYCENGSLRFSTEKQDSLFFFKEGGSWQEFRPAGPCALSYAHSLFFSEEDGFIPDLAHGIEVQKLVHDTVNYILRKRVNNACTGKC